MLLAATSYFICAFICAKAKAYPSNLIQCDGAEVIKTPVFSKELYDRIANSIRSHAINGAEFGTCTVAFVLRDALDFNHAAIKPREDNFRCTPNYTYGSRIAFGDFTGATGGIDGCASLANETKTAFESGCLDQLLSDYRNFCEQVSFADFLVIAAETVIAIANAEAAGNSFEEWSDQYFRNFTFGRTTSRVCSENILDDPTCIGRETSVTSALFAKLGDQAERVAQLADAFGFSCERSAFALPDARSYPFDRSAVVTGSAFSSSAHYTFLDGWFWITTNGHEGQLSYAHESMAENKRYLCSDDDRVREKAMVMHDAFDHDIYSAVSSFVQYRPSANCTDLWVGESSTSNLGTCISEKIFSPALVRNKSCTRQCGELPSHLRSCSIRASTLQECKNACDAQLAFHESKSTNRKRGCNWIRYSAAKTGHNCFLHSKCKKKRVFYKRTRKREGGAYMRPTSRRCSDYHCPHGYTLAPDARRLRCQRKPCDFNGPDKLTCCVELGRCSDVKCPGGYVSKPTADVTFCSASVCNLLCGSDKDTCCASNHSTVNFAYGMTWARNVTLLTGLRAGSVLTFEWATSMDFRYRYTSYGDFVKQRNSIQVSSQLGQFVHPYLHSVYELPSERALLQCNFSGAVLLGRSSPLHIDLAKAKEYYFSSNAPYSPLSTECERGLRLRVSVVENAREPLPACTSSPTATPAARSTKMPTYKEDKRPFWHYGGYELHFTILSFEASFPHHARELLLDIVSATLQLGSRGKNVRFQSVRSQQYGSSDFAGGFKRNVSVAVAIRSLLNASFVRDALLNAARTSADFKRELGHVVDVDPVAVQVFSDRLCANANRLPKTKRKERCRAQDESACYWHRGRCRSIPTCPRFATKRTCLKLNKRFCEWIHDTGECADA